MKNHPILVICDLEPKTDEHVFQIVSKARELAEQSQKKILVTDVGIYDENRLRNFAEYGAHGVVFFDCGQQRPEMRCYSSIIESVIREYTPEIVLFPATESGKNIASIISVRFEAGLTADCIDVVYDASQVFHFHRAAISNSVIADIIGINSNISMGTVKKDVFRKKNFVKDDSFEIISKNIFPNEMPAEYRDEILKAVPLEQKEETIDINLFSVVFCIGRGAEKKETVQKIYQLAEKYHACVTGTKAVIDDQILSKAFQVGQSGKSISPKIYIGLGVSGASQHLVGIKNAEIVIAVNQDENAPIMQQANYAIVDDVNAFLDKMLEEVKN